MRNKIEIIHVNADNFQTSISLDYNDKSLPLTTPILTFSLKFSIGKAIRSL